MALWIGSLGLLLLHAPFLHRDYGQPLQTHLLPSFQNTPFGELIKSMCEAYMPDFSPSGSPPTVTVSSSIIQSRLSASMTMTLNLWVVTFFEVK